MKCPSPVRGRRAGYRFQHSDRKAISGARTRGTRAARARDARKASCCAVVDHRSQLRSAPSRCWRRSGSLAERANAQGAGNSDPLLRPVLDGDPRNPPRFNNSRVHRARIIPRASRAVPNYHYQPAIGAGTTGFDSTGAPRRPKGVQKGRPSGDREGTHPPTAFRCRRRLPSPPRQPSSFCRWRSPSQRCCCPIRLRGRRAARCCGRSRRC